MLGARRLASQDLDPLGVLCNLSRSDAEHVVVLRLQPTDLRVEGLSRLRKGLRTVSSVLYERGLAEARQEILTATEALLRDERRLSPSALASVIPLARSRLEVTGPPLWG